MEHDGGSHSSSSGSERTGESLDIRRKKSLMNALDMKCEREIKDVPHILCMYLLPILQRVVYVSIWNLSTLRSWKQPISLNFI